MNYEIQYCTEEGSTNVITVYIIYILYIYIISYHILVIVISSN